LIDVKERYSKDYGRKERKKLRKVKEIEQKRIGEKACDRISKIR